MRISIALAALAALTLGACHSRPIGHFGDGAFYHSRGHYRVRYAETPSELLPDRWELANYTRGEDGQPETERMEVAGETQYDTGQLAGRGRSHLFRAPTLDLLYRERGGTAAIWARTVVMPESWSGPTIDVVMHSWTRALIEGRAGHESPGPADYGLRGATLASFGEATIDGLPAYWVELDVLRGGHLERFTLVGVRPRDHRWHWHRRRSLPMMLVFGFSSSPAAHEDVRRDFARLVSRVDIRPAG